MKIVKHIKDVILNNSFHMYRDDYGVLRFQKKAASEIKLFCIEKDGTIVYTSISDSWRKAFEYHNEKWWVQNPNAKVVEIEIRKKSMNTAVDLIPALIKLATDFSLTDEEVRETLRSTGYEHADALSDYFIEKRKI